MSSFEDVSKHLVNDHYGLILLVGESDVSELDNFLNKYESETILRKDAAVVRKDLELAEEYERKLKTDIEYKELKEKFERCLPSDKIELIHKTEKVLSFGTVKQVNHCEFLKDILEFILDEKICRIKYSKNNVIEQYYIQFFNISSKYGQWYAIGYNFKTEDYKVFRCDKILNMEESTEYSSKSLSELMTSYDISLKKKGYTEFEIEISKAGADIFYKENYPSMKLFHENGKYFIRGFYNAEEENFITEYFMNYGKNILSIKPFFLKNLIITKIKDLENYFSYNF